MAAKHHVRIEYCVPRGALPNATGLVARILEEWEEVIDSVEVVPGKDGIFDVHVDGELVFTKAMLGHYPEPEDVLPILRTHIS